MSSIKAVKHMIKNSGSIVLDGVRCVLLSTCQGLPFRSVSGECGGGTAEFRQNVLSPCLSVEELRLYTTSVEDIKIGKLVTDLPVLII